MNKNKQSLKSSAILYTICTIIWLISSIMGLVKHSFTFGDIIVYVATICFIYITFDAWMNYKYFDESAVETKRPDESEETTEVVEESKEVDKTEEVLDDEMANDDVETVNKETQAEEEAINEDSESDEKIIE